MKQSKKLIRDLKAAVSAYGFNSDNWALFKDSGGAYVTIIHKTSKKQRLLTDI